MTAKYLFIFLVSAMVWQARATEAAAALDCAHRSATPEIPITEIAPDSIASPILKMGEATFTLNSVGETYPTQFAARKKTLHFGGIARDSAGASVPLMFNLSTLNLEGNGLKPARWQDTGEAELILRAKTSSTKTAIPLRFTGFTYPTRFAARSRSGNYAGIVVSEGLILEIHARVKEKNLEGDGLKPPVWKRGTEVEISFEP